MLAAACLLLPALACALGGAGVALGAIRAPWFDYPLGGSRLVGYSTWNARCEPFTGCAPTRDEAYVIWLLWDTGGPRPATFRVLSLPIAHGRR